MLNSLEPVLIFQFSKALPAVSDVLARIPLISQIPTLVDAPPIPVYMSEAITGLFIDSEDKNIDIDTDTQTLTDGTAPDVQQKGVSSIVTVNISASKDGIGIALVSALLDLVFDKVTSKEYSLTYLHGATTVFRGLLHSYSINSDSNTDKYTIKIEISKGSKSPQKPPDVPVVPKSTGALPL